MEKHINELICDYITKFKEQVMQRAIDQKLDDHDGCRKLVQFIVDYEPLVLTHDDFIANRTRSKTIVPIYDRCIAKRSCQSQCSRRRKPGSDFCGTHIKGVTFGVCSKDDEPPEKRVEIWQQDFQGIIYYIDGHNNVYDTSEVLFGVPFPKIIAKYVFDGQAYSIPEYHQGTK